MFVAKIEKGKRQKAKDKRFLSQKKLIFNIVFPFLKRHLRQVKKYIEEYGDEYKFRVVYLEI